MARIARVVAEGIPHHITQRGNARQVVFDDPQDRFVYLKLLRTYAEEYRLKIWAWCLMSNHVHILAVPDTAQSLARTLGRTHSQYARYRNARLASCGHIWQARYYSCPVDTPAVWEVMAYIERNPVRAGLVDSAEHYPWSRARAHTAKTATWLDTACWLKNYTPDRWKEALTVGLNEEALGERIRAATMTGRPFGSSSFLEVLEETANRQLKTRRPGRPKQNKLGIACTVPN